MGCCISRPSGPNSPYRGAAGASNSSRAINEAQQTTTSHAGTDDPLVSPSAASHRRHRPSQPLSQHINKPLRRHEWSSRNRTWTRASLDRERTDFFDTRVTGRQEVWQTIRVALEVMWAVERGGEEGRRSNGVGGPSEQDPAVALATAQSILTAADVTLPTGDLAQGVYDALGNYYSLPEYVVCDPQNIAQPRGLDDGLGDTKVDLAADLEGADDGIDDVDEVERRREEKGKAVVDVRDLITVRARLSDGSKDVNVSIGKDETVRSLATRVAEAAKFSGKSIRIAYMGKILREGSSLTDQGWKQGHVVNALVFNE
ncbi:hypothetical protein B0T18DRAFT_392208 [Schizothecium vesticola]|uniref:Ubiquitin-like domain-containing protein n=1 Tax=Schizothecium vesticola TaxID=314040 RepID=A0AA40EQ23_9PEZI|nr:hypothetical protein B0T18DRAFT_392208 [Schizothecium vesticola]